MNEDNKRLVEQSMRRSWWWAICSAIIFAGLLAGSTFISHHVFTQVVALLGLMFAAGQIGSVQTQRQMLRSVVLPMIFVNYHGMVVATPEEIGQAMMYRHIQSHKTGDIPMKEQQL